MNMYAYYRAAVRGSRKYFVAVRGCFFVDLSVIW